MTQLRALVESATLRCPACRGLLVLGEPSARCTACGHAFPCANGAIDLYGGYVDAPPPRADPAFARAVARALALPDDADTLARVALAIAGTQRVADDPQHTAEIAELADRLGLELPARAAPRADDCAPPREAARDGPAVEWGPCFHEARMPPGADLLRGIRVNNTGATTLTSDGWSRVVVSYRWLHADGSVAVAWGERSRLPVAIVPGRALTVITRLRTPKAPGDYLLEYRLRARLRRWVGPAAPRIPIRIAERARAPGAIADSGIEWSYGDDHEIAKEMVYAHIRKAWPTTRLRVLEVGGGIHPSLAQLAHFGHSVTALDLSFAMSQLGSLCLEKSHDYGERVAFVACDATDPPLADGAFDCAAVFAATHHFTHPDRLLATLSRLVHSEGFIAVMCEPCLPDPRARDYLRDLAKGINEQAWSLAEWGVIFERAGLRLIEGRADRGSLKALLRK